jgi:hypothetical protein
MKRGNTKPPTLDPMYDSAVLGCTISPLSQPRMVYSLPRLASLVRFAEAVELEEAHAIVLEMLTGSMSKFGPRAPIFVDDTIDLEQQQLADETQDIESN